VAARDAPGERLSRLGEPFAIALARRLRELSGALANLSTGGALPSATASQDRKPANVLLRGLLSSAVADWRRGSLCLQWKHGGESEFQYGWPAEE
jgi:hypothetical protein